MGDYSRMVLIPEHAYNNIIKNKAHDNHFLNHANAKQMTNIVASDLGKINIKFDEGKDKGSIIIKKDDKSPKPNVKTTSTSSSSTLTNDKGTQTTERYPPMQSQSTQPLPTTNSQSTQYEVPNEIMSNKEIQTVPTTTSQSTEYKVPDEVISTKEIQTEPTSFSQSTEYIVPSQVISNTGVQTEPTTSSQSTDAANQIIPSSSREIQPIEQNVETVHPPLPSTSREIQPQPMQIESNIQLDPILQQPLPHIFHPNPNPNPNFNIRSNLNVNPFPTATPPLAISEIESPIITDVSDIPELTYQVDRDDDIIMREYPISNYPLNETRQHLVRSQDEHNAQFANFSNYPPDFYYLNRQDDNFRTVLSPANFSQIRNAAFNMFNNPDLRRPVINISPELHRNLQNEHLIPSLTYRHRGSIPALKYHPRNEENRVNLNREKMRENVIDKRKERREKMLRRNIENENDESDETFSLAADRHDELEMDRRPRAIEHVPSQPSYKGKGKGKGKGKSNFRSRRIAAALDSSDEEDTLKEKMRKNVTETRKKAKDLSQIKKAQKALEAEDVGKGRVKLESNLRKRHHFDYDTDPENVSIFNTYEARKLRIPTKKSRKLKQD